MRVSKCTFLGIATPKLFIKPLSMRGGLRHRLVLEGRLKGSPVGSTSLDFLVNLPPYGGNCSVMPRKGMYV